MTKFPWSKWGTREQWRHRSKPIPLRAPSLTWSDKCSSAGSRREENPGPQLVSWDINRKSSNCTLEKCKHTLAIPSQMTLIWQSQDEEEEGPVGGTKTPPHPPAASHCSPSPACLLTQTKHQWQIGAVVDVSTFSVLVLVWRRPVPDAPQQPRGHWRTTQRPVTVRASPTCARLPVSIQQRAVAVHRRCLIKWEYSRSRPPAPQQQQQKSGPLTWAGCHCLVPVQAPGSKV